MLSPRFYVKDMEAHQIPTKLGMLAIKHRRQIIAKFSLLAGHMMHKWFYEMKHGNTN